MTERKRIAPEALRSAIGGPLALVRDGDVIELDVAARRLDLMVDEAELACRRAQWTPPGQTWKRGYTAMYVRHVTQAHEGCDFDFLRGVPSDKAVEPAIF